MKTLSIKQPWASLISNGLKDIENRTWGPSHLPVRILIHAGAAKIPKDFDNYLPEQMLSEIRNARTMGQIPEYSEMPTSAIIGWADVVRIDDEEHNNSSVWADRVSKGWVLENMHLFDKPITNVKGQLGLFDYPLDEDNLPPSHVVEKPQITVTGDNITVPVSKATWDEIHNGSNKIYLDLTEDNYQAICRNDTDEYVMKPFKTITITYAGLSETFTLSEESGVYYYLLEGDEPYCFTGLDGENCIWIYADFSFNK